MNDHENKDRPDAVPAAAFPEATLLPGNPILQGKLPEHVGKFVIKRLIGEGGMGVVGLGVEVEGHAVKRRVAIKFLKRDVKDLSFDSQHFEQECKALARFNHDNIARFFDFGYHEDNQRLPYIVMEYVEDASIITNYCAGQTKDETNAKPLALRERLELFLRVCDGIRHAHERNVIHRDIAGKNVLVGKTDGKPVVKIIDFGISLHSDDKDLREAGVAGTPAYMSPEQLRGDSTLVDQRSDIYALGILLCELMVGKRPYEFSTTDEAKTTLTAIGTSGATAVVPSRVARELSVSKAVVDSQATALSRNVWNRLAKELRGDLDAIVAKATAFNADDRYSSVANLAEDIDLYLKGYPLKFAVRPSTGVRVIKFVRRNAFATAATLAIVLLLVTLTTLGTLHYMQTLKANSTIAAANKELNGKNEDLVKQYRQLWQAQQKTYSSTLATYPALLNQGKLGEARAVLAATRLSKDKGWEWYYLLGSSDQSDMVLGHSTNGFKFVIDAGRSICAVAGDHSVWFWKAGDGKFIKVNSRHAASVLDCAASGEVFYTVDVRGQLISWSTVTGDIRGEKKLEINESVSAELDFLIGAAIDPKSGRILASWKSGEGARLAVFDLASGKPLCVPVDVPVKGSLCWRADGSILTAGSDEAGDQSKTIYKVWSLEQPGEPLKLVSESPLLTEQGEMRASPLEMVSRSGWEFLRFEDGLVVAEWKDGKFLRKGAFTSNVEAFAISENGPDGVVAVAGLGMYRFSCADGDLDIVAGGNTDAIGRMVGHAGRVSGLSVTENRILSASADGSVRVWNRSRNLDSRIISLPRNAIKGLMQLPEEEQVSNAIPLLNRIHSSKTGWSRTIEVDGAQGILAIFDAPPWILQTLCADSQVETCSSPDAMKVPAFLADGNASNDLNGGLRIVGASASADGRFIAIKRLHPTEKTDVVFGDFLSDGTPRWTSPLCDRPPADRIASSNDGRWVAANRMNGEGTIEEVVLWDFGNDRANPTSTVLKPGKALLGTVGAISFSPSGKWVAVGNDAGQLFLWKLSDGKQGPTEVEGVSFEGGIRGIAFSHPDDRNDDKIAVSLANLLGDATFASGGFAFVRLGKDGPEGGIDKPTGPAELGKLSQDICWNRAGTRLASADTDGKLRVWGFPRDKDQLYLSDCQLVLEIADAHRDEVSYPLQNVCWSSDGRWLAATNADEGCYLYYAAEDDDSWPRRRVQLEFNDLINRVPSIAHLKFRWQDIRELNDLNLKAAVAEEAARIGVHPDEITRWAGSVLAKMAQLDDKLLTEERIKERQAYLKALEEGRRDEADNNRQKAIALANYRLNRFDGAQQALRGLKTDDPTRTLLDAIVSARNGDSAKAKTLVQGGVPSNLGFLEEPLWDELRQVLAGSTP